MPGGQKTVAGLYEADISSSISKPQTTGYVIVQHAVRLYCGQSETAIAPAKSPLTDSIQSSRLTLIPMPRARFTPCAQR